MDQVCEGKWHSLPSSYSISGEENMCKAFSMSEKKTNPYFAGVSCLNMNSAGRLCWGSSEPPLV